MWGIILFIVLTASTALAGPAPVKMDDGDTVTAQSDVSVTTTTATLVSASNSSRGALNCTASTAVRWGHSTVTATKGQQIQAGGSISIHNTAAVYMIAETDTATVSCTEESYSTASSSGVFSP